MKKRKKMYFVVALLFCIAAAYAFFPSPKEKGYGMFSWHAEIMEEDEEESLFQCIDQAKVTEIYQQFGLEDGDMGKTAEFISKLREKNVDVYALAGKPEWARERHGDSLIQEIRAVARYNENQSREGRIHGIMADVEPYLLDEWDEGRDFRKALMEDYQRGMEYAYEYAGRNNLKFVVCIPAFLDSTNEDILEGLIYSACDKIAVMNYNREDEYGQIAKETGLARAAGKEVICIFELQQAGEHDLQEINTYAEKGLAALWQSAEELKQQFGYDGLSFAYHYYEPLKELLDEI